MATEVTGKMGSKEPIAFGRGRQSLEQSVWYSGWLLTFLATGQDRQGQFALQEQVGRKGNVPPPHIHHREDETFYVLEGEMTFSIGDRMIKATPGTMVFAPRDVVHSFTIDVRLRVRFTKALRGCSQGHSVKTNPGAWFIVLGHHWCGANRLSGVGSEISARVAQPPNVKLNASPSSGAFCS